MTLTQLVTMKENAKRSFAFNEITGELKVFTEANRAITILDGDSQDQKYLMSILFDADEIDNSWNLIDDFVAKKVIDASKHHSVSC